MLVQFQRGARYVLWLSACVAIMECLLPEGRSAQAFRGLCRLALAASVAGALSQTIFR